MKRVRVYCYKYINGILRPFVKVGEDADGEPILREVEFAAQPGAQEAFLASTEREVLYSGPRGTGKTALLCTSFLQNVGAGFGAHWKGLMLRLSLTGFAEVESLLHDLILPVWGNAAAYNQNKKEWRWTTGEKLLLGHFADMSDYKKWLGQSWPWLGWEELTAFATDHYYKQMFATNRSAHGTPKMVRATTNPGSDGHEWVRRRFDPPADPRQGFIIGPRTVVSERNGETIDRRAICSVMQENQRFLFADPLYPEVITSSAINEAQEDAWLFGLWDIAAGGLFEAAFYAAEDHFILSPIPTQYLPATWDITRGFDWGQSEPWGMLYAAISDGSPITLPDGRPLRTLKGDMIIFSELYGCVDDDHPNTGNDMIIDDIKRLAIQHEWDIGLRSNNVMTGGVKYRARGGVADNQIFHKKTDDRAADTFADEFLNHIVVNGIKQNGIAFEPAVKEDGSRAKGWAQLRGRLYAAVPDRTLPCIYITSNCKHLLRSLRHLPRDPKKPDDCPRHAEDHLPDVLRYLFGRRRPRPTFPGRYDGQKAR